ncbi:HNH endonuclease [Jannaschia sp. M317]|uniref:HNH endonuclease n=1 Tax=Jannaschia sp. M317 TaxID=2867011 RepID=UPI0021A33870|nr:HNH endonuclease [Jannaschia sp. M317]UWQ17692.1 HNH endonuclease [Jannaschia sp. M317]
MKAILRQNETSRYRDEPGVRYHFPNQYLGVLSECVGDWVVIYGKVNGALGYHSVQKVRSIRPDPDLADHSFAELDRATLQQFETFVPRFRPGGLPYETSMTRARGINTASVRRLTEAEFAAILDTGLQEIADIDAHPRSGPLYDMAEAQVPYAIDRHQILTSRPRRDAAFARMVRRAYRGRCAISGLRLRNGGGRAEVQACHIMSVADGGPDTPDNGIALSGTLHWMFDRGLIRVADDHSLLISHNKVDLPTVERLVNPEMRLMLDDVEPRDRPHPAYLRWHREKDYA